jgi:enoyl-CoA hydratase
MTSAVTYCRADLVSTILMDDGKVDVCFTAGFELRTLSGFPRQDVVTLLRLGVVGRAHPVLPCTCRDRLHRPRLPRRGVLLMAADVRLGVDGPFRLGLNEVRIGLTLPWFAVVLARHRLTPAHFDHAAVIGEMFDPPDAPEAGLLDVVVPPDELDSRADRIAEDLASIDRSAHATTKLRVRKPALDELQLAMDTDFVGSASRAGEETGHSASSAP